MMPPPAVVACPGDDPDAARYAPSAKEPRRGREIMKNSVRTGISACRLPYHAQYRSLPHPSVILIDHLKNLYRRHLNPRHDAVVSR